MTKRFVWALSAALLLSACGSGEKTTPSAVINTPQGPVQGVVSEAGITNVKGIPFAQPPVGDLRWRPPVAPTAWAETRDATEFAPMCMQKQGSGTGGFLDRIVDGSGLSAIKRALVKRVAASLPVSEISEDCLYLNIRTPAASPEAPLPVMVWIHGGGHQFGSGDFSYYQSDVLPSHGVVLVTLNYRLGAFGYLAHPALSADDPRGVSGNYGTLDQIAALEWVEGNISAYGGDPDNVTIFGESAGAWSVTELMASPLAKGLFDKAIGQSGASTYHMGQMSGDGVVWVSGYASAKKLDNVLGLDNPSASELRALPAQTIIDAVTEEITDGFHHNRDGVVFPDNVGIALKTGRYHAVPTLLGYNADEGSLFYPTDQEPTVWMEGFPKDGSRDDMIAALSEHFPTQAETLVDLYNLDGGEEALFQGGMDMMGDEIFGVNVRYVAQISERNAQPAWLYTFNRVPPSDSQTIGAYHAAELPFVFDSHEPILGLSDEDEALTAVMVDYWTDFAKTGNPNGTALIDWPQYQGQNWMAFEANTGEQTRLITNHRKEKLDALSEGLSKKLTDLQDWQATNAIRPQSSQGSAVSGSPQAE
ncbi:carboxylesterase/lipase family protein [Fretibacter rubidus]|uniref:carboxylesterase/lipase family protein n=1 Tax=Fretibacter rubidus TaxID=570162 RepID=UPI00352B9025